ncbi:alpha/beta hydrolase [Jannaschia pohangensis]|uniref:Alpha/beta hydrolase family protein n=1 Tax=Jannaschia pohangensis TaxID=390807 RepID=A0A1I3QDI9_9RHOB|nr:alpha/beta hydrolase [Jannaschia pohangensis]SFJ31770.1 Alpha/beta hydrolase family protein [Jannaschia pohangensis]
MDGWENMDRAALDDAYANADYIAGAADYPPRWQAQAAAFRATARAELDLAYDAGPRATFDLFHPEGSPQGLVVFVHGGYWRRFGKSDWSHFAGGALARGYAVAMVGYPLAPTVRISDITRHVTRAVDAAAARVPGPIRLTGHSAGGQLVARMIMGDAPPACAARIATCVPISPVADLRPLVPQSMNADLRLDPAEAAAESPVLGHPMSGPRIVVHVGAEERPSFLWQAEALGRAWGAPVHVAEGKHHFDVIDAMLDPESALVADICA